MFEQFNSRAYTVADLKSIADRMNLTYPSRATKSVLAGIVADAILAEAYEMNSHFDGMAHQASEMSDMIDDAILALAEADYAETRDIASIANDFLPPLNVVPEFADAYTREDYVTVPELLAITGWSRLPRKYKKSMRKAGHLA